MSSAFERIAPATAWLPPAPLAKSAVATTASPAKMAQRITWAPAAAAIVARGVSRSSWRQRLRARVPKSGPESGAGVVRVGPNDVADEAMADYVRLVEIVERDAIDAGQDALHLHQSRLLTPRQIDLRLVARDDDLRVHAQARQKHLHLQRGGVLGFVEDAERIGKGPASHEGEWRDLDRAGLERPLDSLGGHHRVQRIVERPEVRVNLGLHVARQKAEILPGLDRRTGEDDPAHALAGQRIDRRRNRQVGLASARGADADDDVVLGDFLQVFGLSRRLGCDDRPNPRQGDPLPLGHGRGAWAVAARIVVQAEHMLGG